MDEETLTYAVRRALRRRETGPALAALWAVVGLSFVFGVVAVLGWLDHFLRTHKWIQ